MLFLHLKTVSHRLLLLLKALDWMNLSTLSVLFLVLNSDSGVWCRWRWCRADGAHREDWSTVCAAECVVVVSSIGCPESWPAYHVQLTQCVQFVWRGGTLCRDADSDAFLFLFLSAAPLSCVPLGPKQSRHSADLCCCRSGGTSPANSVSPWKRWKSEPGGVLAARGRRRDQ